MTTEDPLQARRQPVVTATGIILGFVLNFGSTWVKSDSAVGEGVAYLVAVLILVGLTSLIVVLARILRSGVPAADAEAYYATTITIFVAGVSASVAGVLIDMYSNFWDS